MDEISLKKFQFKHVEQTFVWIQDKKLRHLFTMRGEPDWHTHENYFKKILSDPSQKVFSIFFNKNHIGNCGLKNIEEKKAELWLYIGNQQDRGRGIGYKVCSKLIKRVKRYGINVLYLHVLRNNLPAVRTYKKLWFNEVEMKQEDEAQWHARNLDIMKMEKCLYEK